MFIDMRSVHFSTTKVHKGHKSVAYTFLNIPV
ncbi:MAG: hypothetical protein RIR11_3029 [Bacteroidota bacterium]|jgi:hypothetical protein